MNTPDTLSHLGAAVRSDFGIWLDSLQPKGTSVALVWQENVMPHLRNIQEDTRWLTQVTETVEQFGQALSTGFYGQEPTKPVIASDADETPVQQKRTTAPDKAFVRPEGQEYQENMTQPQVFRTEKPMQQPRSRQVVGQPEREKAYTNPAAKVDAGHRTASPAQVEVFEKAEQHPPTIPETAEKPAQAEYTRSGFDQQTAGVTPSGKPKTETQPIPQPPSFGHTYSPLTGNEPETEKSYPKYRPLKSLHDFAAFFSGNAGAIDELSAAEEQPATQQTGYTDEEKGNNRAGMSELPSRFFDPPAVPEKENMREATRYQTPPKPQNQGGLNDFPETNELQSAQSARPTASAAPETNVDDILEALTQKLQREYRRYYGS